MNARTAPYVCALQGATLTLAAFVATACGGDASAGGGWESRVDTIGDTVVVHTVGGSELGALVLEPAVRIGKLEGADEEIFGQVNGLTEDRDGNIWVFDRQALALRKYGPDGAFIATIGREGGGPGEYRQPDGGLATVPDGRVVLRDPGNARYTLYRPDGTYDSQWPGRGGFFTGDPLVIDTAGFAYGIVIRPPREGETTWPSTFWVTELARMGLYGVALDTISIPRYDFEAKEISATRERSRSSNNVPFTGQFHWAVHPFGGIVTAIGDRLAVDWHRPDGTVLRFARDAEPVSVLPDERADAEERAMYQMRTVDPNWRWNGPAIPDTKAPMRGLHVGRDGRIWVQVATTAERIPDSELDEPASPNPDGPPPIRFRAPVVFDLFEPDGRYVGRVTTPRGFSIYPRPIFERDHVWAVFRDELEVNYVVKFNIVPEAPSA